MGQLATLGAGGGAAVGAFTPASISGLYAWWDAATIAQADNTTVTSWADSSGNGHTMTGATGQTYQTAELNGLPGVQFDGVDDIMAAGSWAADASRTVIVVAKVTSASSNRSIWGGGGNNRLRQTATNSWSWGVNQAAANVDFGGTLTNATIVTVAWSDAATANGYLGSGAATAFDPDNSVTSSAAFSLGAHQAGAGFSAVMIYELIVYSVALSDPDRALVVGHLQTKYGI
jgi:hypothetical protein